MNVVDLFAGAGGLSLGFERAGFDVMVAAELSEKAASTYRRNHPTPCLELDLSERPTLPIDVSHVDVVAGGPPCQGFSIAGKRDVDDDRNDLVFDFLHYVEELDPRAVVMENVEGILSMGDTIDRVHDRLSSMGYESRHEVLDASDYGVPQKRNRVFVLALDEVAPSFPSPESRTITVGEALYPDFSGTPNHTPPRHEQTTIDRIENTAHGEALYDSYTQRVRLDPDEPSPTLVCGGPRPQWQHAHPYENRGLTVRERAVLQTFPHDYEFLGGVVSGRVQTGNAVPPELARRIADRLIVDLDDG